MKTIQVEANGRKYEIHETRTGNFGVMEPDAEYREWKRIFTTIVAAFTAIMEIEAK